MASIKGVTIKGIKTFRGHEGEPLQQGNIYIDNKKVGFYSDGDWGGNSEINLDKPETNEVLHERVTAYYKENPATYQDEEMFFYDLLELIELEKVFKKNAKKGLPITVRFEFRQRKLEGEARFAPYKQESIWGCPSEASLTKLIEQEKPVISTIVRNVEDLVI